MEKLYRRKKYLVMAVYLVEGGEVPGWVSCTGFPVPYGSVAFRDADGEVMYYPPHLFEELYEEVITVSPSA